MIRTQREFQANLEYRDAIRADRDCALTVPGFDNLAREWLVAGLDRALADVEAEFAEYYEFLLSKDSCSSDANSQPKPAV